MPLTPTTLEKNGQKRIIYNPDINREQIGGLLEGGWSITSEDAPTPLKDDGVITATTLEPSKELNIPPTLQPTDFGATVDSSLESLLASFNQSTQTEETESDLQKMIMESMGTLGEETTRKKELEAEQGLPQQRTELQGVINQLQALSKQRLAIPLQIQEEIKGRGVTKAGVAPIEAGRLRKNTIEALGLAAIGQTLQGNITLSESSIRNALDAEFEPEKIKLATLQQIYLFNKDLLEREDKKRADNLSIFLTERSRLLGIQEADKKEIYDIGTTALKYGADAGITQKIFQSKTREEAILNAGSFLQDPQAKIELENVKLDNILTRTQIEKANYELQLLQQYGGLTLQQYGNLLKEQQTEINKTKDEQKKAELQAAGLNDKVALIDSVLNSSGINSVVGTTALTRGKTSTVLGATAVGALGGSLLGPLGTIGGAIVGAGASLLLGNVDRITGTAQHVIGTTEQLISQEFLDSLIAVKAKGATFGALQKAEQDALTAAATYIGNRRILDDDGNVVGYNMSEKDFKDEMDRMQKLAKVAYQRATGEIFTDEEEMVFDALGELSAPFNPQF